jgi:uncharacterized protein YwgA
VTAMEINKAIACLKAVGIKPKVDLFGDRIKIQKAIFLLEQKGIEMGFNYGLHLRGPYSPTLTHEIYAHQEEVEKLQTHETLNEAEQKKIKEYIEIFDDSEASILEVAATYALFAYKYRFDSVSATKKVREMKKFYSEKQLALGMSKAKQFLYKPTREELEDIRKEHKAWQEASVNSI